MPDKYFSQIELYYIPRDFVTSSSIILTGDEANHASKVMRHKENDQLYITDGSGNIYKANITSVDKSEVVAEIVKKYTYPNIFSNLYFCIPLLKSQDRFEAAIEKCVELGITNFIVFSSERCIGKKPKLERWQKIITAAMKQSLRSWMPNIDFIGSIDKVNNLPGSKYIFDQIADEEFTKIAKGIKDVSDNCFFVFGPEGGLTEKEIENFDDGIRLQLTGNRLRSETAIIAAASIITMK